MGSKRKTGLKRINVSQVLKKTVIKKRKVKKMNTSISKVNIGTVLKKTVLKKRKPGSLVKRTVLRRVRKR